MSHITINYEKLSYTDDSIKITNFDLSVPGKELIKGSDISLNSRTIYGLIGRNGFGKSSLLRKLVELKQDKTHTMKISTLYVEQEITLDDRIPVDFILDSNYKLRNAQNELEEFTQLMESDDSDDYEFFHNKFSELSEIVDNWNPDMETSKISKILIGLGFSKSDLSRPSCVFSGGWQMRISLARALYLEPDLLLLDEPTNHLDLEGIIWLSSYLHNWKHTLVVVSHNIGFLNGICDYILNIENRKLVQYRGNYYAFKSEFDTMFKKAEKEWKIYDKKLREFRKKHSDKTAIESFIKKNEVIKPDVPYNIQIDFGTPYQLKSSLISLSDVSFGYTDDSIILSDIDLSISMDSKIVLVGPNGCGKSTLIKLMTQEIQPISGEVKISSHAKIGYYNQHFENQLPLDQTPVQYLESIIPEELMKYGNKDQSVRRYLGLIKLEPSAHCKMIEELSGGQKARVAIVKLMFLQPNILILDEPTNHLDIETVDALIDGLVEFKGGILIITHEPEIIKKMEAELWMLDPETRKINSRIDSYESYCKYILDSQ
jgi:ATP-binding cassette subfamily F protein 1